MTIGNTFAALFASRKCRPITTRQLHRLLKTGAAGIKGAALHTLRTDRLLTSSSSTRSVVPKG
jgi:hypothetical protein